ncbi:hypothetical protein, partial [Bosea sp. (in: a-proteobacteria)]|uniref:hypothetical protein n=1 Tax=Bosea sp. (in: a-proteobacteria) TaxID=1871050 RepID=UPI002736AAC7
MAQFVFGPEPPLKLGRKPVTFGTGGVSSIFNLKASNTVNLRTGLRNVINQTADAAIVAQGDSTDRAK